VVVVAALLILPATLFTQQKPSQVSLVRLSSLSGSVTVKHPGATEAIPAQVNIPIEEGSEVSTSVGSSASVKLENASTIQLSELTKANFTQLKTDADGNRLNVFTLEQGRALFHFIPERQDSYRVQIADATVSSNGKAEFQAAFTQGTMQVRVLAGSIIVSAQSGSLTLGKGRFLEYHPSDEPEVAKSHARVVRLSYVGGTVMLQRPGSAEEEKAMLNTPIQEGFELSTAGGSYAEVEFENGSTARLGELSKLLFHQLALNANGNKLNGMTFEQGYATFHFVPERRSSNQHGRNGAIRFQPDDQDLYRVKIADATVKADGKCEFRADLGQDGFRVEVFKGSVEVATDKQSTKLGEGKVLEHKSDSLALAVNRPQGIVKDAWDQWTEARDRQAQLTEGDEAVHPTGPSYGWSDLNTYGEWVTLPGSRFGWSPYAQAGWSPYTNGMWQWYPGMGWTWISAEPWGWVTDHCGLWDFDASFGWFWMSPMFGCGFWYPSLVSWYAGPGWIGWRPSGPKPVPPGHPRPGPGPRPGHPATEIVKVPTTVVQNRQLITAQMANHIPARLATRIEQPPFEPSPRTMSESISAAATATRVPAAASGSGSDFASARATAPPTILMGGDAARESSLLAHHNFHSGREPLRAAKGTTLGGRYEVYGSPGEFRGNAAASGGRNGRAGGGRSGGPIISSRSGGSGPIVASHGSSGGGYSSGGGSYSGGGGGHSSGGGGVVSGGGASASSAAPSAGGGGGHH
jgi:ferric-dicitrate binding protein FerR (iron transport regulator)